MSENTFQNTWANSKTREERTTVPDGNYTAEMMDAKMITGKASGKRMLLVDFIIKNPGADGDKQKLAKFYMFDDMGMGNLKTDLETMGREIQAPTSEEDCVGKVYDLCPVSVAVSVQSKLDKKGVMRTNVYIMGPAVDDKEDEDTFSF